MKIYTSSLFIGLFLISLSSCSELYKISTSNLKTVTITKVRLDQMPSKKSDGFSWDPLGGNPDIYFKIGQNDIKRIVKQNASTTEPTFWDLQRPYTINNLNQQVEIYFYDEDEMGKDDFIGSVTFNPISHKGISYVTLEGGGNRYMKVTLTVEWK